MRTLSHFDRGLFRLVSGLAQALLWSAVAAGFYQVIARYFLHSPADWSEAWTRAAIIWTVMLGIALAFRQGAMLSVNMLHNLLPARHARLLEHLILAIVVLFLGLLTGLGIDMVLHVRTQIMPSLAVSIAWFYVAIPVGSLLSIAAVTAHWAEGPHRMQAENTQAEL